jgi:formate hydrogenlyase subunit 3/multisubunit Na+/H+ antiporter MnhD subunit
MTRLSRLPRAQTARLQDLLPLGVAAVMLLFGLRSYAPGASDVTDLVLLDWIPVARAPAVVGVHVDQITLAFAALAGVLLIPLLLAQYVDRARLRPSRNVPLLQAGSILAFLALSLAGDTLILYVLWEVMGICLLGLERQRRTTATFSPFLASHLSGYGLLLAVLILARGNSGSFHLAGIDPASWHWTIVLMVVAAAVGRIALAWRLNWEGDGYLPVFVSVLSGLSAAYLLVRMYALSGSVLLPPFDVALSLVGVGIALYGAITLAGRPRPRWTTAVERSQIVDVGLMVAALGIGSALGLAAALVGAVALGVTRLPAAAASADDSPTDTGAIGQSVAIATATALPPAVGFTARWLLCAAAIQSGGIVLLLLVVAVTAVEVRSVVVSAVQARLLAEALAEANQAHAHPTESELLSTLDERMAQSDEEALAEVSDEEAEDAELTPRRRRHPSRALTTPDRALLILCVPMLVFAVVPAVLASLVRPSLLAILGDGTAALAASRAISDGAGLPALIAVLVGIVLGILAAIGGQPRSRRAAERRSRSVLTSRRGAESEVDDAASELPIAPVPAALEGVSRGLGQLAGAIESHPFGVALATALILVILALLS